MTTKHDLKLKTTTLRGLKTAWLDNDLATLKNDGLFLSVASGNGYFAAGGQPGLAYPAINPNVVSVGGTYVDVRTDGTRLDEVGWEDVLTHGGGGGGISAAFPRPSENLDGANGVTANLEEVVFHAYELNPKHLAPDLCQYCLPLRLGRNICLLEVWSLHSGSGQYSTIKLSISR